MLTNIILEHITLVSGHSVYVTFNLILFSKRNELRLFPLNLAIFPRLLFFNETFVLPCSKGFFGGPRNYPKTTHFILTMPKKALPEDANKNL